MYIIHYGCEGQCRETTTAIGTRFEKTDDSSILLAGKAENV